MISRPKGSDQDRCAPSAELYQAAVQPRYLNVTSVPIDSTRPGTIRLAMAV